MKNENYRKPFILGMIATTTVTSLVSLANVTNIPGFNIFTSGGVISSSQMNQNFDLINQKIDNIGAVTYVGTYDASVGVDPGSASAGDYYIINSGGIINSTNYVVGDWIVYNGTAWEQVQQGGLKVNKAGDTMTGDLMIDTQLKLKGGTNYVTLKAHASSSVFSLTLPPSAGTAGYVLQTDGTGVLSWVNPSAVSVNSSSITDGSIVDADINATAAIAQSKIAGLATDLANKQPLDAGLTNLAAYNTNGLLVQTSADTFVGRMIAGTANRISVSNSDGIAGNPTLNIDTALLPSPLAGDSGKILKATGANTSSWSLLTYGDIIASMGFTPVNKNGDTISTGTITFNSIGLLSLGYSPVNLNDATNKQYVDTAITSGINSQAIQAPLAGFTIGPVAAVTSADTILVGMGKLQGQISDVLTGNAGNQWIQSGGNIYRTAGSVGIGTNAPVMPLEVATAGNAGIAVTADGGKSVSKFAAFSVGTIDAATIQLQRASGSKGAPAPVSAGNKIGQISFSGHNGSTFTDGATIEAHSMSAFTGVSAETYLKFTTTPNGSSVPTERMRINSDGKVGIGTTAPAYELHVLGQVAGSSAFMNASDKRLKENIHTVQNALDKIHHLRGVSYHFTKESQEKLKNSNREELGVIAQEVKKVFPQAVSKDSNGFYSVAYSMLISPLIEAVKELDNKVSVENKALKEENAAIKNYLCEKDPHAPFCSN